MKWAVGVALLLLVGVALWSLGDLRVRPPGPPRVCPDTPRERAFALAAKRAHDDHLDAVERAAAAIAAGREPTDGDRAELCESELVDCNAAPDLVALTASVAVERARIRADRARLEACDYLR